MHFTISPFGSAGDVHPFLGLALKLRDRAHDVSFVTTGYFEETVRRHGLEYVELGTKKSFSRRLIIPIFGVKANRLPVSLTVRTTTSTWRSHRSSYLAIRLAVLPTATMLTASRWRSRRS